MTASDVLVIGGGIVGITVAAAIKRRRPQQRVRLIDKEADLGEHASGRNSGVLHAGFYYSADSMKARFCREGNQRLTAWCKEHGLQINPCGKLVVVRNESELAGLEELHRRGVANGVPLEMVDAAWAKAKEPRIRTHRSALWSPSTVSVDPRQVLASLRGEAERLGVIVETGCGYLGRTATGIRTTRGDRDAAFVVNCAGVYADRIAHDYGVAPHLRILPFKGLYLYGDEPAGSLGVHVYPVPDLRFPFLGVHFTVTVDGHPKIGPTATPAFWREHYQGLGRFSLSEAWDVCTTEAGLMIHAGFDFRGLAMRELRKYRRSTLVKESTELLDGIQPAQWRRWGRPGIRAQLLDAKTRRMVMDFVVERGPASLHVLNAISPAFTCALPFAEHVVALFDSSTPLPSSQVIS